MKIYILFDNDIDKNVVGVYLNKKDVLSEDLKIDDTYFEDHEVIE